MKARCCSRGKQQCGGPRSNQVEECSAVVLRQSPMHRNCARIAAADKPRTLFTRAPTFHHQNVRQNTTRGLCTRSGGCEAGAGQRIAARQRGGCVRGAGGGDSSAHARIYPESTLATRISQSSAQASLNATGNYSTLVHWPSRSHTHNICAKLLISAGFLNMIIFHNKYYI